jgi:hypothetical protein
MSLVELDPQDLTAAMATQIRAARMSFDGDVETVEDRAFEILWRAPGTRSGNGYSYDEIKPRLAAVIAIARELGPIDLDAEDRPA